MAAEPEANPFEDKRPPRFKPGDRVQIIGFPFERIYRIVAQRGPLGPGGEPAYNIAWELQLEEAGEDESVRSTFITESELEPASAVAN